MEVLTQILQQGTEFDTLAETVLADRFERLVELVTMIGDKGELPIAMALANVVSPQYMVRCFPCVPSHAFSCAYTRRRSSPGLVFVLGRIGSCIRDHLRCQTSASSSSL